MGKKQVNIQSSNKEKNNSKKLILNKAFENIFFSPPSPMNLNNNIEASISTKRPSKSLDTDLNHTHTIATN